MPELPEVEIARRNLLRWFEGRRVVRAVAEPTRVFRESSREDFEAILGPLVNLSRRGKYLLFVFEHDRGLLAHLGMTGKFLRRSETVDVPHSRARFYLDSREVIHLRDPRMFAHVLTSAASTLEEVPTIK